MIINIHIQETSTVETRTKISRHFCRDRGVEVKDRDEIKTLNYFAQNKTEMSARLETKTTTLIARVI